MISAYSNLLEWVDDFGEFEYPIERLGACLFVNSPQPGARLMSLFSAYLDASGNSEQPNSFIVVSGYIANFLQWRMFEDMWSRAHAEAGVQKPFHMSEFMAANDNPDRYAAQKNARSDYVALAKDKDKARKFFQRICIAQQTIANCGISCIVDLSIYNEISSLLDLRKVVPPYALAARMCYAHIHQWEEQFSIQDPVEIIFEKGDFEQGKLTDLIIE